MQVTADSETLETLSVTDFDSFTAGEGYHERLKKSFSLKTIFAKYIHDDFFISFRHVTKLSSCH